MRRDVQTAVSFLTMGVQKPDEDDWGKLKMSVEISKWNEKAEFKPYDRVDGGHQMVRSWIS